MLILECLRDGINTSYAEINQPSPSPRYVAAREAVLRVLAAGALPCSARGLGSRPGRSAGRMPDATRLGEDGSRAWAARVDEAERSPRDEGCRLWALARPHPLIRAGVDIHKPHLLLSASIPPLPRLVALTPPAPPRPTQARSNAAVRSFRSPSRRFRGRGGLAAQPPAAPLQASRPCCPQGS